MKYYFLAAMILLCACSFAQEIVLTDDLNTGTDKIVDRYKLSDKLDPVQFTKGIGQIRHDAYRQIKTAGAEERTLKRLNTDYYLRNVLWEYRLFHDFGARKKFTPSQGKYIDSLIYSNNELGNEELYKGSAAYRAWLDKYLEKLYKTQYTVDTAMSYSRGIMLPMNVVVNAIQNPFVRESVCFQHASLYFKLAADSVKAKKIYQDFNAVVTNAYYRDQIQQAYDNYKGFLHIVGSPAPDFTYTAVDGKAVTLSNLRGKYVYIDIWATWCVPCKEQIPYLMKLEEKYKGKNIRFVSLSVDKQASAGAWRKYVTDNKLTGYQVMSDKDFHSDFIEKFNVAAIPRFLLIDPAGNVVDADAKRPSDRAFKKQLDQLLGIPEPPFALSSYARKTDFSGHWRLNKTKTKFGNPKTDFVSNALNVTKNESALVVERTDMNKAKKQSHYSEQFKLDGTATQTIMTGFNRPEADSLENNPEIPGLTLDRGIQITPNFTINLTETWRLADAGKTLVVDWAQIVVGGSIKIKAYYDKQ